MKKCFKCGRRLSVTSFYRHPMMGDGHLGKCKDCTKQDARATRLRRLEYYREYDRKRGKLPHRAVLRRYVGKRERRLFPLRHRVRMRARRHHRKQPDACQMCGRAVKRLERHHPDYSLPLLIVWLCKPCHVVADKARRDAGVPG